MEPILAFALQTTPFDNPTQHTIKDLVKHSEVAHKYLQDHTGWQVPANFYDKIVAASVVWHEVAVRDGLKEDQIKALTGTIDKICDLAEKFRIIPAVYITVAEGEFPVTTNLMRHLTRESDYFNQMMKADMVEKQTKKIDLSKQGIKGSTFGLILGFLKGIEIAFPSEETLPFYDAVEYLQIKGLYETALKKLSFKLSTLDLAQLSELHESFGSTMRQNGDKVQELILLYICDLHMKSPGNSDRPNVSQRDNPAIKSYYAFHNSFKNGERDKSVAALQAVLKAHEFFLPALKGCFDVVIKFSLQMKELKIICNAPKTLFELDYYNLDYRIKYLNYQAANNYSAMEMWRHIDVVLSRDPQNASAAWLGALVAAQSFESQLKLARRTSYPMKTDSTLVEFERRMNLYLLCALKTSNLEDETIGEGLYYIIDTFQPNVLTTEVSQWLEKAKQKNPYVAKKIREKEDMQLSIWRVKH